ncbi:MAG: efflux RND transporter periplasmic adaptor subunit [Pirellulales bacterium]
MSAISHPNYSTELPAGTAPSAARQDRRRGAGRKLLSAVPTLAVICALAGIGLWGHYTHWTVPKFSALFGSGTAAAAPAWCNEHNVPDAECIECNPQLVPRGPDYGWCKLHGVAQCPFEHPDVAELPETPTVTPAMLAQAQRALDLKPRPENDSRCTLHTHRIQFASTEALDKAGVDIDVVRERPLVEAVTANGEVIYDETRMAHLSARVPGTVWRVDRQVGDRVKAGDILALIDAADVGRLKSEFLQAIAQFRLRQTNYERLAALLADGSIPERQAREAESAFQEAQIRRLGAQQGLVNLGLAVEYQALAELPTDEIARRIQFLGLPAEMQSEFATRSITSNLLPMRAPLDGIVVQRDLVPGEVVATTNVLFTVADISRLWLMLNVRQEDAPHVALGQAVSFQPDDRDDRSTLEGTVAWISTAADDETRTVKVRVDLPNADRLLRANTFGTGRIILRDEAAPMLVPTEAVHRDGACSVVFVRDRNYLQPGAPKFFHVRTVRVGVQDGDDTEIIAGLLPGEVIASKNSVVLEAQLLKSNLGAGCGCTHGQ